MALITLAMMGMGHIQVQLQAWSFQEGNLITPQWKVISLVQGLHRMTMSQSRSPLYLQGWVHLGFFGKPKAVLVDSFDRKLAKRDGRILQQIREEEEAKTGHKKSFFS